MLPAFAWGMDSASAPQVGVAPAAESQDQLTPGLTSIPVEEKASAMAASSAIPVPVTVSDAEPKPKKKEKKKKEVESSKKEEKKSPGVEERDKAMDHAVGSQVEMLREERYREMPYLDRTYIRTTITPRKIQEKEEFLKGSAKDLQALIARAESVHTQAKAAQANIDLYHRRMLYALRKLFPEMTLNFNDRKGLLSGSAFEGNDWHFTMRQPLFNGGILWNTFLQEKSGLEAARKQYDKTIADLVYDLSRAYFEYQRALQTLEEHQTAVEKLKRFSEMSEEKYKQKIISEIESLNVQSSYSQMQFDLESAKQEFEIAKLDLQRFLDLSVHDDVSVSKVYNLADIVTSQQAEKIVAGTVPKELPTVFKDEKKAPELGRLIDMSYANRAELQVEAAKLQVTRLTERIRWGEFLPKAYLTGEWGELGEAYRYQGLVGANNDVDNKDEPDLKKEWRLLLELNWNIGGNKASYTYERDHKAPSITQYLYGQGSQMTKNGVNFGILDGLDAFVNVKQAEFDKLNQVVELEKAEKQVLQDVKQAYYDYQKAVIQVRSTIKRMKYRERLRDFAEHRLGRKEVEISEYMQAEADLVREKADLHRALKDYFAAKAALNHAVGVQDFLGIETIHGSSKQ